MVYVLRYCFLLINVCIRSMSSWATTVEIDFDIVIKSSGHNVTIECATDKLPQDGVYMYKQEGASKAQELFYFYKGINLTYKKANEFKVSVIGPFPNLIVTLLNVTVEDTGLYWCKFNLEDKPTVGKFTWLWIEKEKEKEKEKGKEKGKEKDCPEDEDHLKIFILCAVMLLCITGGICCLILKKKGCWRNKKYKPSNPPSESVYEEMKRSNLNAQPCSRTFINPDYQSSKQLK
ncbi:uncharacterized protein si:rp71-81e14.2 isoform X2 [Pimephales promelas]|nr:uncharacterized protein si:rp71-81e14.2 isoform X2 [Pimephales promelas]